MKGAEDFGPKFERFVSYLWASILLSKPINKTTGNEKTVFQFVSRVLVNQKSSCLTSDRKLAGRTVVRQPLCSSNLGQRYHRLCVKNLPAELHSQQWWTGWSTIIQLFFFVSAALAWVGMGSIRLLLMTFTTFTGSHQSSRASKFKRSLNFVVVDLKFTFRFTDLLIKPHQFDSIVVSGEFRLTRNRFIWLRWSSRG